MAGSRGFGWFRRPGCGFCCYGVVSSIFGTLVLELCSLGDFEIFYAAASVTILGFIIYNVINCFSFRELLKRFGFIKLARRDFYECGFRPVSQKPIRVPVQFLLICVFFLLYDIELIFLFPYVSTITFCGFYDTMVIVFFFTIFFCSLIFDFNRHALVWQY